MKWTLFRLNFSSDGVFGRLQSDDGWVCNTAEHAYVNTTPAGVTSWEPKLPPGDYVCRRGQHQLLGMPYPFEAFEILNVPGHSNILFHIGNFPQVESEGCVLLGRKILNISGARAVSGSKDTFYDFMNKLNGVDNFPLTVI